MELGVPLNTVAEIKIAGEIGLGSKKSKHFPFYRAKLV